MEFSSEANDALIDWMKQSGAANYIRALYIVNSIEEIPLEQFCPHIQKLRNIESKSDLIAKELVLQFLNRFNEQFTIRTAQIEGNIIREKSDKWLNRELHLRTHRNLLEILVQDRKNRVISRNVPKSKTPQFSPIKTRKKSTGNVSPMNLFGNENSNRLKSNSKTPKIENKPNQKQVSNKSGYDKFSNTYNGQIRNVLKTPPNVNKPRRTESAKKSLRGLLHNRTIEDILPIPKINYNLTTSPKRRSQSASKAHSNSSAYKNSKYSPDKNSNVSHRTSNNIPGFSSSANESISLRSDKSDSSSSSFLFTSSVIMTSPPQHAKSSPREERKLQSARKPLKKSPQIFLNNVKTLNSNSLSPRIVIRTSNNRLDSSSDDDSGFELIGNQSSPRGSIKYSNSASQTERSISKKHMKVSPRKKKSKPATIIEPTKITLSDLESLGLSISESEKAKAAKYSLKSSEIEKKDQQTQIPCKESDEYTYSSSISITDAERCQLIYKTNSIGLIKAPDKKRPLSPRQEKTRKENVFYVINITVAEAKNIPLTDLFGTSDPYCQIQIENTEKVYTTKVVENSQDPKWNETFVFQEDCLDEVELKVQILDSDPLGTDEVISSVSIPFAGLPNFVDKWFLTTSKTTLKIQPQVHLIVKIEEKEKDSVFDQATQDNKTEIERQSNVNQNSKSEISPIKKLHETGEKKLSPRKEEEMRLEQNLVKAKKTYSETKRDNSPNKQFFRPDETLSETSTLDENSNISDNHLLSADSEYDPEYNTEKVLSDFE
ncbi:hypothetical protein TRFO_07861 [Tritrichomonas foetus]|uniref:C2 domain-containing protein n=1 Tax=Tritrichomonas foetus TaxID=1144522 RepID=A0A1J4JP79_9EUKA|nr:hypothetical protein TRFO_07861 [Tritrichomonas foetus]|eukprot:OHT00546.1 hypothetical protein TRFO_07861 [Tritrichomonas foetus]